MTENDGHEIDGHENDGHEIVGQDIYRLLVLLRLSQTQSLAGPIDRF